MGCKLVCGGYSPIWLWSCCLGDRLWVRRKVVRSSFSSAGGVDGVGERAPEHASCDVMSDVEARAAPMPRTTPLAVLPHQAVAMPWIRSRSRCSDGCCRGSPAHASSPRTAPPAGMFSACSRGVWVCLALRRASVQGLARGRSRRAGLVPFVELRGIGREACFLSPARKWAAAARCRKSCQRKPRCEARPERPVGRWETRITTTCACLRCLSLPRL